MSPSSQPNQQLKDLLNDAYPGSSDESIEQMGKDLIQFIQLLIQTNNQKKEFENE